MDYVCLLADRHYTLGNLIERKNMKSINSPEEIKRIKKLWRNYKRCAAGKSASCDNCIGCADRK